MERLTPLRERPGALLAAGTLLLAALAFAAVALTLRRGIPINQDGWFYWQGSVSILQGLGYRDFTGRPIRAWPPLYPEYLALWQLALGISARTIVLATAFATAAAVASWAWLLAGFAHERGRSAGEALCALAFVSAVLALYNHKLRAESLFHVFFPLLLGFTLRARASARPRGFLLAACGAGAALLASLLTRNAALGFLPAVLAVLLCQRQLPWRMRAAACGLVTALALPGWLAVRGWLGQLGRHPFRWGGRFEPAEYLWQLVSGIDRNTGLQGIGLPLLVVLAIGLVRSDAARASGDARAPLGRAVLLFTLVSAAALFALFNVTWIQDKPEARFALFVTLALGGLGILGLPSLVRGRWLALVLVVLFAEPTLRLGKNTLRRRGPGAADYRVEVLKGFAPSAATIDPAHFRRPPEPRGRHVLVSPPYPRERPLRADGLREEPPGPR